jgi:tritrans,polycis-undecaprenyl-diphosphate synthase [geranylgeranyl-diphosphate specific]
MGLKPDWGCSVEKSLAENLATSAVRVQRKIRSVMARTTGFELDENKIPLHVGIIPDGNRRYSRIAKLSYQVAYNIGYENLRLIMKELLRMGVKYLSVYAMSLDNCTKRSTEELATLHKLVVRGVEELARDEDVDRNDIRVIFFGDLSLLPEKIRVKVEELEEMTSNRRGGILGVALCYSIIREIEMDKKGCRRPISYKVMPPIDLVIRTGGQKRLSDFFPVNARYAELFFSDKPWPAFGIEDLYRAVKWFQSVPRNFGK